MARVDLQRREAQWQKQRLEKQPRRVRLRTRADPNAAPEPCGLGEP
jgi:hypothetical protein